MWIQCRGITWSATNQVQKNHIPTQHTKHSFTNDCQIVKCFRIKTKTQMNQTAQNILKENDAPRGGKIINRTTDNNAHLHFCDIRCMFTFDRVKFIKPHTFKPFFYFLAHIIKSFLPCQFCLTQRIARMKTYQESTK